MTRLKADDNWLSLSCPFPFIIYPFFFFSIISIPFRNSEEEEEERLAIRSNQEKIIFSLLGFFLFLEILDQDYSDMEGLFPPHSSLGSHDDEQISNPVANLLIFFVFQFK